LTTSPNRTADDLRMTVWIFWESHRVIGIRRVLLCSSSLPPLFFFFPSFLQECDLLFSLVCGFELLTTDLGSEIISSNLNAFSVSFSFVSH
jgi:hypothetical protein